MMLYPPVADLVNKVGSRYALVNLVAKRARDISSEAESEGESLNKKAVSIAIDEVYTGKITLTEASPEEETAQAEEAEAAQEDAVPLEEPVLVIEPEDEL
jgi:DNA-directed RNA polymerase subunit omega